MCWVPVRFSVHIPCHLRPCALSVCSAAIHTARFNRFSNQQHFAKAEGDVAGATIWSLVQQIANEQVLKIERLDGTCDWGSRVRCSWTTAVAAATGVWVATAVMYFLVYYFYIVRTALQLKSKLYQDYRLNHQQLQLEVGAGSCCPILHVFHKGALPAGVALQHSHTMRESWPLHCATCSKPRNTVHLMTMMVTSSIPS